ncbi:hypothetical protein DMC61_39845 [Amycolatopsis sp. WAC 04169]|nr:hypothetical protein DMC61_39845 [Amycolatopsis sp. WAC 04169]
MHIPADVRRFLEFTLGLSWPESDDQGLVALWKAWEAFEDAAGVFEAACRAAGTAVPDVLEGATGEFFARFLSTTISDGVAGLRESSGELGRMAQNAAADVYKTKVMFVVFAAFTLASVLHLLATLIGALFTGVVIAAARVALTAIWKALVTRLGQLSVTGGLSQATKAALLKAAKDLALKTGGFAAFGAALMGGTDFGVQARQIADGDRDGWDTRSLTSSLAGGALGGAFAGVFHSAAGGIRKIAFDLRDGLASREPGGLFADGVTIGQVTTAVDGPLAALGDLVYATGQMITVIVTAPLINLALGAPAGNPALGALGALSRYGGGRGGGSTGGGGALDSVHPPVLPDFSIPAKDEPDTKADPGTGKPAGPEKFTTETTGTPEKAEPPPPYTATEATDFRADKTPAYTSSHALGALFATTPTGSAEAATSASIATAPPFAATERAEQASAAGVPGSGKSTITAALPSAVTPGQPSRPEITTASMPASAMTSAPTGLPATAEPVSPAAVAATDSGTVKPGSTGLPALSQAAEHTTAGRSSATAAFLAGSAPPSRPDPADLNTGQDSPRPLRTVALPGRGGVAFVSDLHAGNVRAAFPEPTPGVYRVLVESGDNDTFVLPGRDDLATSKPRHHLATALAGLPPHLATWNRDTTIELLSCYLTPTDHTHLSPLLHASLGTTTLTFPHAGTPITVHPDGDVRTIDTSPEPDESVLHLGPKRKRDTPTSTLAPETQRQLAIAADDALHRYGSIEAQQLSRLVPRESLPPEVKAPSVAAAVSAARERLKASGQLWTPHYAGASRSGRFDLAEPDELTVWLWWQAASRPDVSAPELVREAVLAGFTPYAEMPAFARKAIDAADQDGRRHRPGDPPRGPAALGRLLATGVASDRSLIKKIIHAMAWSDKTATAEELAARLIAEAVVTGSVAELETLARGVVANADRAGDRLVTLSVTDTEQASEAMDRALVIVSGTPRLREPERLSELIKHLRIRHITGPQDAVEEFAARVRRKDITEPAGGQELSLDPLVLRERVLDMAKPEDKAAIGELASEVVSTWGNTDKLTLLAAVSREGVKRETFWQQALDPVLEQARAEGWLWHPIHAGREGRSYDRQRGFTPDEPTRLTAFLWLLAINHPTESSLDLAHRAYQAGFTNNEELKSAAEQALAAAVRDGRRHPALSLADPAHRDGIRDLISALVAGRDPAKQSRTDQSVKKALRDYNVHGAEKEINKEIAHARREHGLSANSVRTAALPKLSTEKRFAGRVLDANILADHASIRTLAYAAATMDKFAGIERLSQVLADAGVVTRGDPAAESDLRLLIGDAAADATANGDRLETLSIIDEADRELVLARAVGVLRSTPELHARGEVGELVAHLRMRHISGPHTALEKLAHALLSTPFDDLAAHTTVPWFAPAIRARKPNPGDLGHQQTVIEAARKIVEEHGDLENQTLRPLLRRAGAEWSVTNASITTAKQQAVREGWSWSPTYQGVVKLDDPGHREAMLWLLAVDHPHDTASDLVYRAERAGLTRSHDMHELARAAITAAEWDRRRHPLVHVVTEEDTPQVHALIDAVLITEPELGVDATVLRLYEHNVLGPWLGTRKAVRDRQAALAEHPPDETRKVDAANTLTLNRKGTFYGRTLRSDVPEDRVTIEKLAYAVVWAHKTDTPSELARRLEDNGVIAEPEALAGIVAAVVRLADHHGDRLQRLSADLPTHREAIRRRTLEIAIAHPDSRELTTPDLVRLMRQRNTTGSRNHLSEDADTVRALLAQATPHVAGGPELGVPVDFGGHEVRVIPRRHGAGFVTESFGRHILNARVPEQEGVFDLFAAQRNDYYFLPGYRSGVVPSTPDRFLAGLAGLPARLVVWSAVKEIRLWACDLDTRHVTHLNRLMLDPAFSVLGHVTITAARPGEPILIAPDGRIHTADDGTLPADTLHLGRKRKIDETGDATTRLNALTPDARKKIVDTAKALFLEFGNISVDDVAPLTRQQDAEGVRRDDYRTLTLQARNELKAAGDLWAPLYRGASRKGVFDPNDPDELTTWLAWQVTSRPDAEVPDLALTAQKAGFTNSRTELRGYARQALKIAEDDGLRLGRAPAFLGRSWDVAVHSDRRVIERIAYAAAWSDKDADAGAVTDHLSARGVTGPREEMLTLVSAVVDDATRNGDRLGPLSVADPARQPALVDRALGIVFGSPELREAARLNEFVKHLRIRHVTGSQEDLKRFAADIQGIPDLPSAPAVVAGQYLLPLGRQTIEEMARRIVIEQGVRSRRTFLVNHLKREAASQTGMDPVITRAVEQVENEGLAWHPVHRGQEAREYHHRRGFSPAEPTELTAFLWLLVVDHQQLSAPEIARLAGDAGFAESDELHLAVTQAIAAAVRERRRHPILSITRPDHRPAINTLIAGLHAADPEADDAAILTRLRSYNVTGKPESLTNVVRAGRNASGTPSAVPVLRSGGTFAGRTLDVDVLADVKAIARLAYAAACVDKTADIGQLVYRLAGEGVTGSYEALNRLAGEAITEATRNGDRLETLSIFNAADVDSIRSRVLDILRSEPALRGPDRVYELISHMRMRRITGPHQFLEKLARDLQGEAPAQRGEPPFDPVRRVYGSDSATARRQKIDELAREVVAEHGALSVATLASYLTLAGVVASNEATQAITRAVRQAQDDGTQWLPTYRGVGRYFDEGHLDAVLWQLAIDHPQAGPLEIARLSEHAGFAGTPTRRQEAERAIAAAERDRRRHPLLPVSDHAKDPRVDELIDALLLTEPGLDVDSQMLRSFEYNLSGRVREIREQIVMRTSQLTSTPPDPGVLARARAILTLQPGWTFRGRRLDAGTPADFATIGTVAYAAAWAHKSEGPDELVDRLIQNGVVGTREALRRFAAEAITEAIGHGDRIATLSADLSPHEIFIHDRVNWIVGKIPGFAELDGPRRTTELVRSMRRHRITGSQRALRAVAETHLGESLHLLSPIDAGPLLAGGTAKIHSVAVIELPRNSGVAFVDPAYTRNITAAFARHRDPGELPLALHHREGHFLLPGSPLVFGTPTRLAHTLAALPVELVSWSAITSVVLYACDFTSAAEFFLQNAFRDVPTLSHITVKARFFDTPVHVDRTGAVSPGGGQARPETLVLHPEATGIVSTPHPGPPPSEATLAAVRQWRPITVDDNLKDFFLTHGHATRADLAPNRRNKLPDRARALVEAWAIATATGKERLSAAEVASRSGDLVSESTVRVWRRRWAKDNAVETSPSEAALAAVRTWRPTAGDDNLKHFLLTHDHATEEQLTPDAGGRLPAYGLALAKAWVLATAAGPAKLSTSEAAAYSGGLFVRATVVTWRQPDVDRRLPGEATLAAARAWRPAAGDDNLKHSLLTHDHATEEQLTPDTDGKLPAYGLALAKAWVLATAAGPAKLSTSEAAAYTGGLATDSMVQSWRRQWEAVRAAEAPLLSEAALAAARAWRPKAGDDNLKHFLLTHDHATEKQLTPDAVGRLPAYGVALVKAWALATATGPGSLNGSKAAEHAGGLASNVTIRSWRRHQEAVNAVETPPPHEAALAAARAWRPAAGDDNLKHFLLTHSHATEKQLTPDAAGKLPDYGLALVKAWVLATAAGPAKLSSAQAAARSGGLVADTTVSRWRARVRQNAATADTSPGGEVSQLQIRPSKRRKTLPGTSGPEFVIPADIRELVVGFDPEKNRSHPSLWALLEHLRATRLPGLDLTRDSAGLPTSITTQSLVRDWATARAPHYPGDWIAKMSGWAISPAQAEELSGRIVTQREIRIVWEDQGRRRTELAAPEGPADTYVSRAFHYGLRPIHGMDDMFYWRDPADPLYKVAPRFAGPDGDIHPVIRANADKITAKIVNGKNNLKRIAADPDDHKLARTDAATFTRIFRTLEENITAEIRRIVRTSTNPTPGTITEAALGPTDPDRPVYVGQVLPEHVAAHEQRLVGQLGLYLTHPPGTVPDDRQPTLRNGRVLGIYAGAHFGKTYIVPSQIDGRHDLEKHWKQRHPHYPAYNMYAGRGANPEQITAEGAGNSTAFANSATLPTGGIDQTRVNTVLLDIEVTLPNKNNPAKHTTIGANAYIALDNAFDPTTNPHGAILVDYSDHYDFTSKEKTFKREDPDEPVGISHLAYQQSINTDGIITTSRPR